MQSYLTNSFDTGSFEEQRKKYSLHIWIHLLQLKQMVRDVTGDPTTPHIYWMKGFGVTGSHIPLEKRK